jgi:hypothetical protein
LLFSFNLQSDAADAFLERDPELPYYLKKPFGKLVKTTRKYSFQTKMNYVPEIVDFEALEDYTAKGFTHENTVCCWNLEIEL